jgi:hypothetical protein
MAVIVFHAGMPKAGSTSLQEWLAANVSSLRARGVDCVRIVRPRSDEPARLEPATPGNVVSTFVAKDRGTRARVAQQLCDALDTYASNTDICVVTSESYEVFFNGQGRRAVLPHLDSLSERHDVRVAYYVRPQHEWLESAWLQWGFRRPTPPATWLRGQQARANYFDTYATVREVAPRLAFTMRPFRNDLLDGGHVVHDFARTFLGTDDVSFTAEPTWSNRSLPLEAAILLREAPAGMFWSSVHDNKRFYPLKERLLSWGVEPTALVAESRAVLQHYAHETYEPGNRRLIEQLGWPTDHFVPPPETAPPSNLDLDALNEMWKAKASDAELQYLWAALHDIVTAPSASRRPAAQRSATERAKSAGRRAVRRGRALLARQRDRLPRREPPPPVPAPPIARRVPSSDGSPVVDIARDVGLDVVTRTFGAVVFDYDNDGWPDIFLGRHDAPAFLFRNVGGRFVRDDAIRFPGKTDRHCAVAGDVTGNGRLDLFCVVGGASGHEQKGAANELWLQQDDGTFVNRGEQPGLADPWGRGREAVMLDATGNGRLDILVGNVSPRSDGKPSPNRLYVNEGGGVFRPAPELGLDLEYSVGGAGPKGSRHGGGNWPMGRLATLDTDGNGWTDVVMCAQHPEGVAQCLHLFRNDHGRGFHDVTADVGLHDVEARDVVVTDLTGDGRPDLVVVDRRGVTLHLNEGGTFRAAHHLPVDDGFRLAVGDADGDGHPDIYVMRTKSVPAPDVPDMLLIGNGSCTEWRTIMLPTVEGTVRDDAVYAIDYDRDGRSEFLVLHGHSLHAAPLQLIALR